MRLQPLADGACRYGRVLLEGEECAQGRCVVSFQGEPRGHLGSAEALLRLLRHFGHDLQSLRQGGRLLVFLLRHGDELGEVDWAADEGIVLAVQLGGMLDSLIFANQNFRRGGLFAHNARDRPVLRGCDADVRGEKVGEMALRGKS